MLSDYVYQRVSNPIALDIIESLHQMVTKLEGSTDRGVFDPGDSIRLGQIAERLNHSGLAMALAGGPGMLPEQEQRGHWLLEQFHRLHRPRSYPALARRVAANLEWYLRPEDRVLPTWFMPLVYALLGMAFIAAMLFNAGRKGMLYGGTFGLIITGGMLIPGLLLLAMGSPSGAGSKSRAEQYVHARALMEYLIEQYSDNFHEVDETGPEDRYGLGWG